MMRRKFSLANIPLLNIGPARLDNKQLRDQYLSPTDSRPPTPRSVRPPLPIDIDAELRAACTYIVTHPKPSHEVWTADAPKPALDYAAVKYDAEFSSTSAGPVRKPSTRSRSAAPRHDVDPSKYSYRPNVATEDLFRQDERGRAPGHAHARSRVDQLMAPEPVKVVTVNPRAQLQPPAQPDQHPPHDATEKNRISTRSDSVGTSGSTPHTDTTDYPWSASTPMTSAAITPARGSKRASSQNVVAGAESGSVPKVEPVNAEWMRSELNKHKKAIEEREREREREADASGHAMDNVSAHPTTQTPVQISRVPPRKPVPSRPESRQAKEGPQEEFRQGRPAKSNRDYPPISFRGRSRSSRPTADRSNSDAGTEERGRGVMRSSSRLGRAASRAASKAGSITNDIITHYLRPAPAQEERPTSPMQPHRSSSRMRNISTHIRDYIKPPSRPGTSMGSRKPSIDIGHGHRRNGSTTSLQTSATQATTESTSRWRNWHPLKSRTQAATPDMSRPGSSGSAMKGRNAPEQRQSPPKTKPPIDLNRELPPLPGLDQWKADEENAAEQSQAPLPQSTAQAPQSGLRRMLSRRDKTWGREHIVTARLGSPTPPRSQKQSVDAQRYEPSYSIPSPPVSLSPDVRTPDLSQCRSIESPLRVEQRADSRLRSGSNQTSTSGFNLSIFPQPANGVSTTGKRRAEMRNVYGGSSTSVNMPRGHSRTNSSTAQKPSMDEYPRSHSSMGFRPDQSADKDKTRRKWWQSKDKQQHADRMNQVAQSGARNGMLVPDEAAAAPVIRF